MVDRLAGLIAVAKGKLPADLILANAKIINVFTGEIAYGNVAVYGQRIAGTGNYAQAKQVLDLQGKYLAPGLINGHVHLESSMLDIGQYARAVVPRGISALITDLHEIANVAGLEGLRHAIDYARRLPFEFFLMAPTCVPSSELETSGANIGAEDIRRILRWRNCIGLGEVMNFPGVLNTEDGILRKLLLADARIVNGHAPGVSGKNLSAYISAGIYSDHESVSLAEAKDKLQQGMWVMIREGSYEQNLETLLPLVTDKTYKRCFFVTDDRNCEDLLRDGDIDAVVRKAIKIGLDPVRAIQLATINTAEYFHLPRIGGIAPGYLANLAVISDLSNFLIEMNFYHGKLAARDGEPLFHIPAPDKSPANTVHIKPFTIDNLQLHATGKDKAVIELVPGQVITRKRVERIRVENGLIMSDIERDILKLVVVERHRATGNIGIGLVRGFGLKRGAMASSVAHDSHNIIAVGTNDKDIFISIKQIERMRGGLCVVAGEEVLASLALPVAGLLSDEPIETVTAKLETLEHSAGESGVTLRSPFSALSFLALPVIPELRLTDFGLVDVNEFKIIE